MTHLGPCGGRGWRVPTFGMAVAKAVVMLARQTTASVPTPHGPRTCPRCGSIFPWGVFKCRRDGAALAETRPDSLVGKMVDQYRVIGELGAGGCGRVYRAIPTYSEQTVALKVLHADASPMAVARFHREAQALRRVRDTHVVSLIDAGRTARGLDFLVMEHVAGHPLSHEVAGGQPIAADRAAALVRRIALGLDAVHRAGMIHRDIKPANVMVTPDQVKLIDLGTVGGSMFDGLTQARMMMGTPLYMAPELFEGALASERSDLYALGVLLYELLTGRPPFSGGMETLVYKHLSVAPERIDGPLGALALELLSKRPGDRPASARAVADRLAPAPTRIAMPTETTGGRLLAAIDGLRKKSMELLAA